MCTTGWLWVFFSLVMVPKTCSLPPYFWLNCYSVFSLQNTKGLPIEIMTYSVGNCIYDRLLWENVNIYHLVHATFPVYKVCPRLSIWCIKIFFGDFKKQQSVLALKDWLCINFEKVLVIVIVLNFASIFIAYADWGKQGKEKWFKIQHYDYA